jgi:hypothetical protein
MKKKTVLWALSVLVVAAVLGTYSPRIQAEGAVMYIDPPVVSGIDLGTTFKINVTMSNVVDLYGWQFSLYYRGDFLNASKIEEGPFLKTHPDTDNTIFLAPVMTDTYNSTHGLIIASSTLSQVQGGVNGSGTLATVTFKVKQPSSSTLHLTDTKLVDSMTPFGNLIPHTTVDGTVYSGVRDVAVTNVQASSLSIRQGQNVTIDVTVANLGTQAETFNVTTYYDSNIIGRQTVSSLASNSTSNLTFTWSTTGVEPDRTYIIKAEAQAVLGELNLDNNMFIDGTVTVRPPVSITMKITEAIPCNQSGYATDSFTAGSLGYFKVTLNNTSLESAEVLVTVNVYDSSNATLGVVSFKGTTVPGISTFILGLPIRSTASRGTASVYANAYTDWPFFGGVPFCPEVYATFQIINP